METNSDHIKFVYENHSEFQIFPSIIGSLDVGELYPNFITIPGCPFFEKERGIHTEQFTEFHRPIKVGTKLRIRHEIVDLVDKGPDMFCTSRIDYFDDESEEEI